MEQKSFYPFIKNEPVNENNIRFVKIKNEEEGYLNGKILNDNGYRGSEVHIDIKYMEEYYSNKNEFFPGTFIDRIYEVKIHSGRNTRNTGRYIVSLIINEIENKKITPSESLRISGNEIDYSKIQNMIDKEVEKKVLELTEKYDKKFQYFYKTLTKKHNDEIEKIKIQLRVENEIKVNDLKREIISYIYDLQQKVNCLKMIIEKISNDTFLNDVLKF